MARLKFGRAISLRWNGLLLEGPAETVFEIPDEYYEEFEEDIHPVEPTLVWLDTDEGETIRDRLDALEAGGGGGGVSLSSDLPLALGTAAAGSGTEASRDDHVHPTTGLALSGHNHSGVYDPAGTAASAISTHEAASDPHPTYLTDAEGDAQYSQLGHTHTTAGYTTIIKQYVKNDSTAKSKGEAVYISSADGTNPIVSYADADTEATSSKTLGLLEQDLTANEHGWVVTEGVLTNINTSAATAGQSVWLSSTAGGRVYGSPPAEPAHGVYLGVVTKANASTGEIFVKVQNGYELNELHDVSTGSAVNGDVIQYDGSMWNSKSLSAAGISATSHAHAGVYDPAGTAASAVSTHEAASDPHPTYLTSAEGNAAYATTGHSHSYVTSATGTTDQVNVSASTGAVTFSLPQSIATTSSPTFTNITASGYIDSGMSLTRYSAGGSTTTATNVGTSYVDVTDATITFTPNYVGQNFIVGLTAGVQCNSATAQYILVQVNDGTGTLFYTRVYSAGSGITQNASGLDVYTSTGTSSVTLKMQVRMQSSTGVTVTSQYTRLFAIPIA